MEATFESAKNHEVFQQTLDRLIINQFCTDYKLDIHVKPIDGQDLIKASWLASILGNSKDEGHQFLAASFAKLLYLQNANDEQRAQLAYTILSRTGNLTATNHIKNIFEPADHGSKKKFKRSFGAALDIELGTKRNINSIKLEDGIRFVTDFQNSLWGALKKYDHVSISAPTSAGKSFFVQHFIATLCRQKDKCSIVYIVPTKALISQATDDFKQLFRGSDILVRTAYVESDSKGEKASQESVQKNKIVYCLTPERCLKLLQQGWKGEFRPDLIFIDEIQNVSTNDNRAVLLEYLLGEINKLWLGAKIISAGPFVKNGKELYKKLLSISAEEVSTFLPPVYQLRVTLRVEKNDLTILIHLRNGKTHEVKLESVIETHGASGKFLLAPIVDIFGKPDGNLIYAAKADWCVTYAMEFIKTIKRNRGAPDVKTIDPAIKDLIDLIKDDIHPDYALIYCLRYKVAFHHGKLPDIVKNEIEYLFKTGVIEYLFCTSTLLQGVNLPAPRMFILSPKKESQKLSRFEFGNLIGRAGRINKSLVGTIFCLERDWKNDPWSAEFFNSGYATSVIPTSELVLQNDISEIISTINREPKLLRHTGMEYTLNLVKQKYLENRDSAIAFLSSKGMAKESEELLVSAIEAKMENVDLKNSVTRLNPIVDPVLQNRLYSQIKNDGIEGWVLHDEDAGNQHFNKVMTRSQAEKLDYRDKPMYYQLESLAERMNPIFGISKEAWIRKSSVTSIRQMIFHGMNWINGLSLSQLIRKELEFASGSLKDLKNEALILKINEHINKVINVNSLIVTFILVKYFKLLVDLLESMMTVEERQKFKRTLLVPTMLELGSRKLDVIIMISSGIPRSIAIRLSKLIPESYKTMPIEWLRQIKKIDDLPLKSFYLKYLFRKGYLPELLGFKQKALEEEAP